MHSAECKIVVFPSEMNIKYFYFVRKADTFILHFTSSILHFVVFDKVLLSGCDIRTRFFPFFSLPADKNVI